MSEELKLSFDVLDVNTKRNQISSELMLINELINKIQNNFNIANNTKIKNYDQKNDKNLREAEILTFFFEDIYNIEQELISILCYFDKKINQSDN